MKRYGVLRSTFFLSSLPHFSACYSHLAFIISTMNKLLGYILLLVWLHHLHMFYRACLFSSNISSEVADHEFVPVFATPKESARSHNKPS